MCPLELTRSPVSLQCIIQYHIPHRLLPSEQLLVQFCVASVIASKVQATPLLHQSCANNSPQMITRVHSIWLDSTVPSHPNTSFGSKVAIASPHIPATANISLKLCCYPAGRILLASSFTVVIQNTGNDLVRA